MEVKGTVAPRKPPLKMAGETEAEWPETRYRASTTAAEREKLREAADHWEDQGKRALAYKYHISM